jgi:hypothetical protein
METIIGLLIVLLPLVFKLIGKRLEQAGQVQPQVEDEVLEEDWAETVRRYVEQQQAQAEVFVPSQAEVEPQEKTVVEAPRVVPKKKSKPILIEEEKKEKEKIDVKKMIVYSEIMKPKYTE